MEEKDLKELAYNYHIHGQYKEAQTAYKEYLKNNPDDIPVCFLYAQLMYSLKDYNTALEFFLKVNNKITSDDILLNIAMTYYYMEDYTKAKEFAEKINNSEPDVLNLKAYIYTKLNETNNAITMYKAVYESDNNSTEILLNISLLYKQKQEYKNAFNYGMEAYNKDKNNLNIIMNMAEICEKLELPDKHFFFLNEADKLNPDNEDILFAIANIYKKDEDYKNQLKYYMKIININPNNYMTNIELALLLIKLNKKDMALSHIKIAETIKKDDFYTYYAYCEYYNHCREYDLYLEYAKKLMNKDDKNSISYSELIDAYNELFDYNNALKYAEEAIEKNIDRNANICRKAGCIFSLGKTDEAVQLLENSNIEKDMVWKKMYYFVNLTNKNYEKGMKYYLEITEQKNSEFYKKLNFSANEKDKKKFKMFEHPWKRESLKNKTLLIYQGSLGYGDYLMFSRYIPLIEKEAGKVVLSVLKNLYDLFKLNFKNSIIIEEENCSFDDYDYSVCCMDILYGVNKGFDIPFADKWLDVPDEIMEKSELNSLFKTDKRKIGIFWQGNPNILKNRPATIQDFIPLFELEDCQFYSLDITKQDKDVTDIIEKYNITDCKEHIKTAVDTAIALKNLDYFITIDSFPLHLAGALGVKTKLLLSRNSEWRWFNDTKKTPWYDSVTIYKQTDKPDWTDAIQNIKEDLKNNV